MQCRFCQADIPHGETVCPLCHHAQYQRTSTASPSARAAAPLPHRPAAPRPQRAAPARNSRKNRSSTSPLIPFLVLLVIVLAIVFGYLLLSHYQMIPTLQNILPETIAQNSSAGNASSASTASTESGRAAEPTTEGAWKSSAQGFVEYYNSKAAVSVKNAASGSTIDSDIGDGITISVTAASDGRLQSVAVHAGLLNLTNETTQTRMLSACQIIGGYLTPGANVSLSELGIDASDPSALLGGLDESRSIDGTAYRVRTRGMNLEFSAQAG